MAKRRVTAKRRTKNVKSFRQAPRTKRSQPIADQLLHAVYSQEALEPRISKVPSEHASTPLGDAAREDILSLSTKLAKQYIHGALDNARAFSTPPLANSSLMRNGTQAITRALLDYWVQNVDLSMRFVHALPKARSPHDLLKIQSSLGKEALESMPTVATRISEIAVEMATEAGRSGKRGGRTP